MLAPALSATAARLATASSPAAFLRCAAAGRAFMAAPLRLARPMVRAAVPARGLAVRASMADDVRAKNAKHKVIIYSKTYCPYCSEVKALFEKKAIPATIVELDTLADGADVAEGVAEVTGRRTVPQVFIGGKHVGGCDDTNDANKSGALQKMLAEVGLA